ncbi:MAG: RagB/SusD family nutrient uptake outer membrane protein [Bacteroidales bacterium]|nr:RagB/SusD family nutrient uptake outer membrane protein [Bacteroidales bacterium]
MKKFLYLSLLAGAIMTGCNEDDFLKEEALDFNSASNSYNTAADFDAAINELYFLTREEYYTTYDRTTDLSKFADMWITADPLTSNVVSDLSPSGAIAKFYWDENYKLIAQANTVISRVPNSTVLSDDQKKVYEAKARFFRALGYRTLAYLYGDVPLQLEEVTSPKTDYTREAKATVLAQCVTDLEFAAANLPEINTVKDGEISKPAANMLLAELCLATGDNNKAVTAATAVISNPNLSLMTQRYGSQAGEAGDVFYDLFRPNNQNRASGNKEAIWVIQFETNVEGGGNNTSHFFWNPGSFWGERFFAPQVDKFKIIKPDGTNVQLFNWPIGDMTGGRGIGTHYAVEHLYNGIWANDFDDMRNSEYNWPRKFKVHRPEALAADPKLAEAMPDGYFDLENTKLPEGYSMETGFAGGVNATTQLPNRFMCGYSTKMTTPFHHPAAQYGNAATYQLAGTGGKTYTDQYFYRLAEAYLLRAEAYVNLGQKGQAAADINVLRNRANAKPCTEAQMSIDYILDERLRELVCEEKRRLTLARTGKLYERITKYNPYFDAAHSADKKAYDAHYDLFPIPQSAILANKDGVLTQNPGYGN